MAYKVEWTNRALRDLKKIDKTQRTIILAWVKKELETAENPCALSNAKPLEGVDSGWRWRIGTYRLVGTVDSEVVTITLFRAGHRRDVYRNLPKKLQ